MSNEITKVPTTEELATKLQVPALIIEHLQPDQMGWLQLRNTKKQVFDDLQKSELAVQGFLQGITAMNDLPTVQDKIKQANAEFEKSKGQRLHFTGMLNEKIITPAMEFEKRNTVLLDKAKKHELKIRIDRSAEYEKKNAYTTELALLKTHIENENFRIAAAYRVELAGYINMQYIQALKSKTKVKEIPALIESIKNDLASGVYKPEKPAKFARVLVTDEDAMKVFNEVPKYNPADDIKNAQSQVDAKFLLYAQDLKNATEAIETANTEMQTLVSETNEQVIAETSVNNLVSQSIGLEMTGGPKVIKKFEVAEHNTQVWAITIMAFFMKNIMMLQKHVKVKEWSKLSIGQMAAAIGKHITDTQIQVPGIETKIVKK